MYLYLKFNRTFDAMSNAILASIYRYFFLFRHRQRGIVIQFTLSCPWDVICQGHGRLQSCDWPRTVFLTKERFRIAALKKNPHGLIPLKQFYASKSTCDLKARSYCNIVNPGCKYKRWSVLFAKRFCMVEEKADRYWPSCCTFVNAVKIFAVDKD